MNLLQVTSLASRRRAVPADDPAQTTSGPALARTPALLLPTDEPERLAHLRSLGLAEPGGDPEAARFVELAAMLCGVPMAALTIVDATRQRYLASRGLPTREIAREHGLCARAIVSGEPLIEVPDTARLPWFDPLVHGTRAQPVRFYACVPLRTRQGSAIGTLCVMDSVPRRLTRAQREALLSLAASVASQLDLRRQLREATQTDRLTGLSNWSHFEDRFEAGRPERGVACFVRLKSINQIGTAHGFRTADALIRQFADRLRGLAAEGALVGRIKRGLFLVFFPGADPDGFAQAQAQRLATRLEEPYRVDALTLVCPVHLGFADFPRDGRTLDDVVNAADVALQLAIERDEPAVLFDSAVAPAARAHYRLEPQLREALARDEFINLYQPKVDLGTGRLVGVEALVRWVHPQRGLLTPAEFVPALEATGLIREAGRHILRRAVADWRRWREAGLRAPRIAVNVAAAQLREGRLLDDLRDVLAGLPDEREALAVEVTESVLIGDMEQAIDVLARIRALGIPVAIDDFGTGYSSLSYIVRLPVDEVKIDRSFVERLASDDAYRGIVATCVGLARNLGLKVVAEGIETPEQARQLQILQCDHGQGFLYSPAVSAAEIAALLTSGRFPV
ncbi:MULTISPECIES: putative bifunctional diguanylate cyclase/phosphodiesterase [Ramlibacter]|uniref:EAL domain-containing protein n=1 Tax=Ramlibacter pinisoli TaxID=2682844 RepID=A0A6N8ISY8_9BURK|nr:MULTISPECIES: sensor domain-containing phosphodiesterase [Ramlibacter]MBA2964983.1 sensor domain-containing phosphodiesterase [Ramlibacter sp. CGMCC 1.13660]MVQ29948.1 EAL domain-containing protein [Ramlibacter pinisoli]